MPFSHPSGCPPLFPLALLLIAALNPNVVSAEPFISPSTLDSYLQGKSSPLAGNGPAFIDQGITFNVDPRLVVGIAGAETTFATNGTCVQFNNAWNWFWCGAEGTCSFDDSTAIKCQRSPFASFAEGIQTVTKFLRLTYMNRLHLTTIRSIGATYCKAGCGSWEGNVTQVYQSDLGGDVTDLGFSGVSAAPAFSPYDHFAGSFIDGSRWSATEFVREIRAGKLVFKVRTPGVFISNDTLVLRSTSGVTAIEAEVVAQEIAVPIGGLARARVGQTIYNDGTSEIPGVGDIVATIATARRAGSGLFVLLRLSRCATSTCAASAVSDMAFPGVTPGVGQTLRLGINWDGAVIRFRVDGQEQIVNPATFAPIVRPPTNPFASVGAAASGIESRVAATFDNVRVNGALFDDFSGGDLDAGRWRTFEFVREIQTGHLTLRARTVGGVVTNALRFRNANQIQGMQATVAVTEVGTGSPGNQVARLIGTFYKSFGTAGGVGFDGDIFAAMRIIGSQAFGLQASFTMFRCQGTQCSAAPHIFTDNLDPVALGSRHTLFVHWDGSQFSYGVDDTVKSLDPGGFAPMVSPTPGLESKVLDTQAFSSGSITATFDDVMIAR